MIHKNLFVSALVSSLMLGASLSGVSADVSPVHKNSSKAALKTVCAGFGTSGILSGTASFLKRFDILTEKKKEGTESLTELGVLSDEKLGKYIGEPKNAENVAFWVPAIAKAVAGIGGVVSAVLF